MENIVYNTYQTAVRMFVSGRSQCEILSTEGTTQGDPLSMAIYALGIPPLIRQLHNLHSSTKQVWFADDASASATCAALRNWWDELTTLGPLFRYHPKPSKTHLVVKENFLEVARNTFADTGVQITSRGQRHLGAAIGSQDFIHEYVSKKVMEWTAIIEDLAEIAHTQPHAAYAAYTHGIASKWLFITRTIPDIEHHLTPLEDAIRRKLIPALTGHHCNDLERSLLALPTRLGGMNIANPTKGGSEDFAASLLATAPLRSLIQSQTTEGKINNAEIKDAKQEIVRTRKTRQENEAGCILSQLPQKKQRLVECSKEKGASMWLNVLPISNQGFALHKGAFRDAVALRYGWQLSNLPSSCACGAPFDVDHAMICSLGGFPIIRHNELRDVTAELLSEVCADVTVEPPLQPITGETFLHRTARTEDDARPDIRARGFWNTAQEAFFDIRVFHPNSPSYRSRSITSISRSHEMEKKRMYGQRIREVEHGAFTPFVFTTSGGMARECKTFFSLLASAIAEKQKEHYSKIIALIRVRISFALLRSALMAIRGTRSLHKKAHITTLIENSSVALTEAMVMA